MKTVLVTTIIMAASLLSNAQSQSNDWGICFNKANKKSIMNKMDNFLTRVSEETGCSKATIRYEVDEYYTQFYSKNCRHLPKRITFDACGDKRTYKHNGLSGAVLYWLLGSWTLDKK